jgi:hypothetical protein
MAPACYRFFVCAVSRVDSRHSSAKLARVVPRPSLRWSFLIVSAVAAGASFAACSSTKATNHADAGNGDASVDADDDGSVDAATGPDDVAVYPEAPSLLSPDGCYRLGATCMDNTTCCSAYCVEGGCSLTPRQM